MHVHKDDNFFVDNWNVAAVRRVDTSPDFFYNMEWNMQKVNFLKGDEY